ncbi:glycosyl hydrolase family 18 protein [Paenibacillus sp. FJAT-26967]|uniref:glycosyl hydrolase family 18 protein n=1 Tax=Paenibacillus sp. FJAT-26967 TaxID=1729690 RepID=UPI0008392D43|nr:glycosyl hydrolase family 18 protein [Paenibacillus sp. FJAT-26967]
MEALKKSVLWKWLVFILCTGMIFSSYISAFPGIAKANSADIEGHWAQAQLTEWHHKGLLEGYPDGSLKPDKAITRVELMALINRFFNLTETKDIQFSDVTSEQWQYKEVSKAVTAGYVDGYSDGTIKPDQLISRQEAAVMLSRVLPLDTQSEDKLEGIKDSSEIADWSKKAVNAMVAKGVIDGYEDGTFRPNGKLTRAEAVVLLSRTPNLQALTTYDKAGTYGPATGTETIQGGVSITVPGVTLQNMVIKGNLILGKGIGEGDATLKNVKVEGTTTVNGGGANSIYIVDSNLGTVVVDKASGIVRLVVKGNSSIQNLIVKSPVKLEEEALTGAGFVDVLLSKELPAETSVTLSGQFATLTIAGQKIKVDLVKGTIETVKVTGSDSAISVQADATIVSLILDAIAKVTGNGTVQSVTVNEGGKGSAFDKAPGKKDGPQKDSIVVGTPGYGGGGSGGGGSTTEPAAAKKLIAYAAGWETYSAENPIDATKLTHLIYSFTHVKDGKIVPAPYQNDAANYAYLHTLKNQNPKLKLMIAIGGWGADGFSDAVLTEDSRNTFADSIVKYIVDNKLDGVDLDWEYPTLSEDGVMKARSEDKPNFTLFVKLLREKLNKQGLRENKYYEISMAAGASKKKMDGIEADKLAAILDNINIMTYDFEGNWSTKTGHHTNLYGGSISVDSVVKMYRNANVPANKIVIGAAFYSHIWYDVKSTDKNGLGQAATGSQNTPTYNVIAPIYNKANGFTRYWDDAAKAPYLFDGSTFLSYDDAESVTAKARYVLEKDLGGAMFWEYGQDRTGVLVGALADGLQGKSYVPDNAVPAAPQVRNVTDGQTYTSGVLPNWTDAPRTVSAATLNGKAYTKGTGITEAGTYVLVVTAANGTLDKTASTTVNFTVDPQKKVIAYAAGWNSYSADSNPIDAAKLTHLIYSFTHVKNDRIVPAPYQDDAANYAYLHTLKNQNPNLKLMIAVGGWGADGFSDAVLTEDSRDTFADSIVQYMVDNKLDGVDIDWEYPTLSVDGAMKSRPEDKKNYTLFLQKLREKLNVQGLKDNKYYEISMAAGASNDKLAGIEAEKVASILDNINIMTYDFEGGWSAKTGHHTNLYGGGAFSVDSVVNNYKAAKVPANKIVIGVAFYSHIWYNVKSTDKNGLGQSATGSQNTPTYNVIAATYNEVNGFTRYWDDTAKAPYLFDGSTFLSYDDAESAAAKAQYVLDKELGGAMFWEYGQDKTGVLLGALADGLQGKPYVPSSAVPAAPQVINVVDGQTYTSGVLPNWTDAPGIVSGATLNGKIYTKGTGITEAGTYVLVVTAANGTLGKTASTTVNFTIKPQKKVIGYIAGWEDWSVTNSVYANKLTHLDYSFTHVKDGKIIPLAGQNDEANYAYLQSLKAQNPKLKILIAIGGWGADGFSDAVLTDEARNIFTDSIIDYIKQYKLDGVDLDWEYPSISADGVMKARPEDTKNFTLLLQMLREKLNKQGLEDNKYYEISMAGGAGTQHIAAVEIDKIAPLLDNINIMTYDFEGGWSAKTGHHTNLYGPGMSADMVVKRYQAAGMPSNKIVIGAGFYSHIWYNVESTVNNGLGQKAKGSGNAPTYNDILANYNSANGFVRYWDDAAKAPYLFDGTTFLSYDDPQSVAAKAQYVVDNDLGGAMFWEYGMDKTGALLDAIVNVIPVNP